MTQQHQVDDMLATMHAIIAEHIPFNKVLGLTVESLQLDQVSLKLPMRDELIGNFVRGTLHGGVISATLDVTGGLVAFLGVLKHMRGLSWQHAAGRFAKLGTIDLRIDYLRPGIGTHFLATGYVLRTGKRVAVTRMEFQNHEQELIAVGTGAYIVA
jgi:uncharacterized protein (TIGR00369 family)